MRPFEEGVLFECLLTARAWELLHTPAFYGTLDMEQVLELALAAGCTQGQAQKLANQRGNERLARELPP